MRTVDTGAQLVSSSDDDGDSPSGYDTTHTGDNASSRVCGRCTTCCLETGSGVGVVQDTRARFVGCGFRSASMLFEVKVEGDGDGECEGAGEGKEIVSLSSCVTFILRSTG